MRFKFFIREFRFYGLNFGYFGTFFGGRRPGRRHPFCFNKVNLFTHFLFRNPRFLSAFSYFCNIFRPQCPFFCCFAKWSWQNGACGSGGNRVRPALLPAFLQGKWHAARAAHLHLLPVFFRFLPEK